MLHVHHAPHAEALVSALAGVLATPPEDPLAIDRVAVHSRGLERWLAQRLSHRLGTGEGTEDGICAAVAFPFPGTLIAQALGDATGIPRERDPWQVDRAGWALLGLLERRPELADDSPLHRHLAATGDEPAAGRLAAVRRVADLFDRYAVHRPAMLVRWVAGDVADPVLADGRPLPASGAWQARLWRALRDELDVPSPAERLQPALARLADEPEVTTLPARLSLFGLTALPASYLAVLRALAVGREVHLLLSHPSPALWRRGADVLAGRPLAEVPDRDDDPLGDLARNPLLRAWGRDAREMQVVLAATTGSPGGPGGPGSPGAPDVEVVEIAEVAGGPRDAAPTLLQRLRADVRGDVRPPGPAGAGQLDQRPALAAGDVSVQVHACHGLERQVEVLRDVLLHRLAADPTLEPRDILVLCPDVERVAPLIEATFAAYTEVDAADPTTDPTTDPPDAERLVPGALRVRLADRSLKRTNPLLRVVADLLDLADGRVSASQVLDLAGRTPVRDRFGFDDAELERIDTWVRDLAIRWGLDSEHRHRNGVPTDANTWRRGLDRLLVGVAVADEDDRTVGEVVPYDDVTASDIDLAGRLAELLARIEAATAALRAPRAITAWRDAIRDAVRLLTDTRGEAWQAAQLHGLLDEVVAAAEGADPVPLCLAEVRDLLGDRLQGAPGRASHRTGDLTVCSLVPMRSVPHRVVCLLGMDDGAFPRRVGPDGDDLLELAPRVGDRDPRTEDRQLLLDALLAADEQLIVTYTGRDERTNEPCPPAVPIGELLDVIDRTVTDDGDDDRPRAASEQVTVHHPLHPFDPRNFVPGHLGVPGQPLGSDDADLAGARALAAIDRTDAATLLHPPLEPPGDDQVLSPTEATTLELDDLERSVIRPVPTLLAERLGLWFFEDDRTVHDELDVELAGLQRWAVGERLLSSTLAQRDRERLLALERARDSLPPGQLAASTVDEVVATVDTIVALATEHGAVGERGDPVEVEVPLPGGRRLVGAVDGVLGDVLRQTSFSRLKNAARLRAWIRLVVLTAADPARPWRAVTVARTPYERNKDAIASAAVLPSLGDDPAERAERAGRELERLVALHDLAVTRPLPLATETSARFAQTLWDIRGGNRRLGREARARAAWEGSFVVPGERADLAYGLVFGRETSFSDLLAVPADDHESGEGWDDQEPTRFGRWALRLWTPVLTHEQMEDRA